MTSPSNPATAGPHVSASQLRVYDTCPARYAARYLRGVPDGPPSAEMLVGRLVHRALEVAASGRDLEECLIQVASEDAATLEEIAAARVILRGADVRFDHTVEVEKRFDVATDTGAVITGVVDRIDVAPDGAVYVTDYKTGGNIMSRDEMAVDPQALIYLAYARAAYPDAQRVVAVWHYLSADIKIHLPYDEAAVTPAIIAADALFARKRDTAATWPERANARCNDCPIRETCQAYRAALAVPSRGETLADMAEERVELALSIKLAEARKGEIDAQLHSACEAGPVVLGAVTVSRAIVKTKKYTDMVGVCRTLARALGGDTDDYIARIADVSSAKLKALAKGDVALEEQLSEQAEVSVYYRLSVSPVKNVF